MPAKLQLNVHCRHSWLPLLVLYSPGRRMFLTHTRRLRLSPWLLLLHFSCCRRQGAAVHTVLC